MLTTLQGREGRLARRRDSRDEMNIAEFPIALLSDRSPNGTKTIEFQDTIRDQRTGNLVTRKLTILGTEKLGLPTAKDDEVILALIYLTRLKNNLTERQVHFSRYELIQLLGWGDEGKSYHRLEESLHRWASVYLSYENAWWDNQRKSWVDEGFHIIERVTFYDRERRGSSKQGTLPFSYFTWNEVIFRSFQDGYIKALDLDFFLKLQSPTAKRIYRFLDKHFYHRPRLEYDLQEFAHEHIGLSRTCHTGQIKEKLAPAIEELESEGFLERLSNHERYLRRRRGEWRVIFLKHRPPAEVALTTAEQSTVPAELVNRGVTAAVAAELVAGFPPERIRVKIDVFDWLKENNDKRLSTNPAGYLVQSIRDDYQPPQGFEPKEQRDRKRQATEERKKQREQQQELKRRKEEQEIEARRAERAHVDGYLKSLSSEKRAALEAEAFANADPTLCKQAQGTGPLARIARALILDREVLRIHPLASDRN